MQIIDTNNQVAFEDECFRCWLNIIDARIGYDRRFAAASVATWRIAFDEGDAEYEAIAKLVR